MTGIRSWFGVVSLTALAVGPISAQQQPLTQLQFDIVGVRLVVDPPALTVPKNIPTYINATLVTPPNCRGGGQRGDRVALRRRDRRSRAARTPIPADANRHAPVGSADPDPAARAARRLLPRRRSAWSRTARRFSTRRRRRPAGDDDPDQGHQRSLRDQRDVAAAVARRDPRQGHRHRQQQLPAPSTSRPRSTSTDTPFTINAAGGAADGQNSCRRRPTRDRDHRPGHRDQPDSSRATRDARCHRSSTGRDSTSRIAALPFFPSRRRGEYPVARHSADQRPRGHCRERRVPEPVLLGAGDGDQRHS